MPSPTRTHFAWLHPRAYLGVHAIVGLLLSIASAWAFFAIADAVPEHGAMVRVDTAVTAWLQTHGTESGESILVGVSYLGAQFLIGLLAIVVIVLIVRRSWRHLVVLAVTCGGGALVNVALKSVFHRTRPSFASEFHVTSWSFPSGHAMDSLIVYGLLAYWVGERWPRTKVAAIIGAAALVVAIGYARIYLGVHYLSDVVGGYAAGFTWLAACATGYRFAARRQVGSAGVDEAPAPHSNERNSRA
jgi:membrane-associated phospholipid phosphatase